MSKQVEDRMELWCIASTPPFLAPRVWGPGGVSRSVLIQG